MFVNGPQKTGILRKYISIDVYPYMSHHKRKTAPCLDGCGWGRRVDLLSGDSEPCENCPEWHLKIDLSTPKLSVDVTKSPDFQKMLIEAIGDCFHVTVEEIKVYPRMGFAAVRLHDVDDRDVYDMGVPGKTLRLSKKYDIGISIFPKLLLYTDSVSESQEEWKFDIVHALHAKFRITTIPQFIRCWKTVGRVVVHVLNERVQEGLDFFTKCPKELRVRSKSFVVRPFAFFNGTHCALVEDNDNAHTKRPQRFLEKPLITPEWEYIDLGESERDAGIFEEDRRVREGLFGRVNPRQEALKLSGCEEVVVIPPWDDSECYGPGEMAAENVEEKLVRVKEYEKAVHTEARKRPPASKRVMELEANDGI